MHERRTHIAECAQFLEDVELPAVLIDVEGVLSFGNAAWRRLAVNDDGTPWAWTAVVSEDEARRVRREMEYAMRSRSTTDVEFHARRSGTHTKTYLVAFGPFMHDGEFVGMFGVAHDVTDRRRQEQRLAFMAGHDPLTGLANRRAFEEALGRAASLSGRDIPSVLVLLDMDHLKRYNDARGHLEGDQALVNLALMLRTHIRASDLAARIGGDEFALILSGASIAEADEIVQRICASSLGEFVAGARAAELGVSGGIAAFEKGVDSRVVMDRADAALYTAKNQGRHQFVTWIPEMGAVEATDILSTQVQEAFAAGETSLVFQPVVRLSDGEVAYYESLVRVTTAEGMELLPAELLPVVQRLGLMPRLTRQVLGLALEALADNPGTAVSVNLSGSDVADELLLADVTTVLEDAKLDPGRMVFEISEDVLLADVIDGRRWIDELSALGCRFVVDDFGTGLGLFDLLRIPGIEQMKLSQAVTGALADSRESRQFVRAVRELIESHGKTAVAAFVQDTAMLADAVGVGFRYFQGHVVQEPDADLGAIVARMAKTAAL